MKKQLKDRFYISIVLSSLILSGCGDSNGTIKVVDKNQTDIIEDIVNDNNITNSDINITDNHIINENNITTNIDNNITATNDANNTHENSNDSEENEEDSSVEDDDTNNNDNSNTTLSGKVIDGYIKNATLCFDLNNNNSCDSNEPQTITDKKGNFTLSKSSNIDDNISIIAYGGTDLDSGNKFEGLLKSPQSFSNITPISTIIKSYIDMGKSEDEALEKLANVLEIDKKLLKKDPIQELNNNNDKLIKANLKIEKSIEILASSRDDIPKVLDNFTKDLEKSKEFDDILDSISDNKKDDIKKLVSSIDKIDINSENIKLLSNLLDDLKDKIENGEELSEDELVKSIKSCELNPNLDDSNFKDTPPNNGKNIPYFTIGESVSDIETAFNYARSFDSTINGKKLSLPSQEIWDSLSLEERGLYILNRERIDRGLKPFEGVVAMNQTFNELRPENPKTLADVAQAYSNLLYNSTSLRHDLDDTPKDRINRVQSIKGNIEHIPYDESLYAEGNNYKMSSIPIEKAIYTWIYADEIVAEGKPWGHRAMCLMQIENDDFGAKGAEGILAFGLKQGEKAKIYPDGYKSSIVTLNAINPIETYQGEYKKSTLCLGENSKDDRFIRDSGLIKDTKTSLIWQDINQTLANLNDAKDYCKNLELGGFDDWRLPKALELSEFYKSALSVGVTPNLSQINISKMSADGGFVLTLEGATKYSKATGDITNDFSETSKGDVRCVRGESNLSSEDGDINEDEIIKLDNNKEIAIDKSQTLMFENNSKIGGRANIEYGKITCNNLELGNFKDWRLPTPTELSTFHKNSEDGNISLNYYATFCTYEVTNEGEGNKYKAVRVQKSDDKYKIGDIVTFGSSAGIRCVRDIKEDNTTDTIPPARVKVAYIGDENSSIELNNQEDILARSYIKIDYKCLKNDNNISCKDISIEFLGEPESKLYSLEDDGKLPDNNIATLDSSGKAVVKFLDSQRRYIEGFNSKEGHFYSQLGDYVLVDEAGNISPINKVFLDFFKNE